MRQTAMTQGIEARTEGTRTAVAVAAARSWLAVRWPYLGIAAVVVAATAFLLHQLMAWPPHEDETLALFIGRDCRRSTPERREAPGRGRAAPTDR